jgi:spore coat polysaccharide biosynthesis protein SpsF (cytidylyltransferase family)
VAGAPLLVRVVERAKAAERVDTVVIATSTADGDDAVASLAAEIGVDCYRGSEQDVLGRVLGAARAADTDIVVRLTGDCPLLDPDLIDMVVARLVAKESPCDYASNILQRTFPKGLDAEALHLDTLTRIDRLAESPEAREHVTWFAYRERPDLFLLGSVRGDEDFSGLDWSVDDQADLDRVRALYARYDLAERRLPWRELA